MITLFKHFLDKLGSPKEQKNDALALASIVCMFFSFTWVTLILLLIIT